MHSGFTTIELGGISFVITVFAPITDPLPIVTGLAMTQLKPRKTSSSITTFP